jgi:hypothetical protein
MLGTSQQKPLSRVGDLSLSGMEELYALLLKGGGLSISGMEGWCALSLLPGQGYSSVGSGSDVGSFVSCLLSDMRGSYACGDHGLLSMIFDFRGEGKHSV